MLRRIFISGLVSVLMYSLLALGSWLLEQDRIHRQTHAPMVKYVQNRSNELREQLFGSIFDQAIECTTYIDEAKRKPCQSDVDLDMAKLIIEEELESSPGLRWPHDLYFMRYTRGDWWRLGWGGQASKISEEEVKNFLDGDENMSYWLKYQLGLCQTACSVQVSIDLPNNGRGYLVRAIGIREDDNLGFLLWMPLVNILSLAITIFSSADSRNLGYQILSGLTIPISIVGYILTFKYLAYKKKTKLLVTLSNKGN